MQLSQMKAESDGRREEEEGEKEGGRGGKVYSGNKAMDIGSPLSKSIT